MGIIGAGLWGGNHAAIYNAHPFAETVAIADEAPGKAKALAEKMKIPNYYENYEEMITKSGCDAVAIVTPDFAHAKAAIFAAEHKKHVLVEKPLATTREEVYAMVEAFEKNKVRAMVDLHNRWNPTFNVAHQSVTAGELGNLISGYMRLNDCKWVATDMLSWAAKSSILWFLGSHSLDTLRWFFNDDVARVYSVSKEGLLKKLGVDTVDMYLTTLEFKKGGVAQMENGWITPNANPNVNDFRFNILGDKGMMSLDLCNHNMIQKYTDTKMSVPDIIVKHTVFDEPEGFAFKSIKSFVDCIIDNKEFHVSIKDAANTSLALLAVMESAKKREPVEVKY
jgi:predicted dehydrogenase